MSLRRAVASEYLGLTSEVVHGYAASDSSERYYSEGVWQNGDPSCWYCNAGPAVGAAYLVAVEPAMLPIAVATFNRAITEYRLPNGSFMAASPAISSAAFSVELGLAYVRLAPQLDPTTLALWQTTLAGIADFLISDKDVTWYANGNINSSYAAALYFAWRATGAQKYLDAYNAELQFLVAPPGQMWVGFGLTITQQPTQEDGSDGRGFLTEGSPPGFDPEYSHLQLDFLSALYSASGDPRVLRLLNLILNEELTRTNPSTFILNATGGTRKNEMMSFTSAALPLLVIDGQRPDLRSLLPAAFARLTAEYKASMEHTDHNDYRGVALWLAPILLATSGEHVQVPKPGPEAPASSATRAQGGGSPAPQVHRAGASPAPARDKAPTTGAFRRFPALSSRALGTSRIEEVEELQIPGLEYALAASGATSRGVALAARDGRRPFATFACTRTCSFTFRPLLVVHRGGASSTVVLQSNLPSSRVTLRAGQVFVGRVSLPRAALQAARAGRDAFVRLRVTVLTAGEAPQGRSATFKVLSR